MDRWLEIHREKPIESQGRGGRPGETEAPTDPADESETREKSWVGDAVARDQSTKWLRGACDLRGGGKKPDLVPCPLPEQQSRAEELAWGPGNRNSDSPRHPMALAGPSPPQTQPLDLLGECGGPTICAGLTRSPELEGGRVLAWSRPTLCGYFSGKAGAFSLTPGAGGGGAVCQDTQLRKHLGTLSASENLVIAMGFLQKNAHIAFPPQNQGVQGLPVTSPPWFSRKLFPHHLSHLLPEPLRLGLSRQPPPLLRP